MSIKILKDKDNLSNNHLNELATSASAQLNGLLIAYDDDQLNERVKSALRRKSRVRYKCMDTFANFLAFGTTGGAVYLFKLKSIDHSSCSLASMIPCDQGSIEVIKFLPNPQTDDLLVAIGTSRGSVVIFKLTQSSDDDNPIYKEIYKAESYTNNQAIKMIECDQDLFDLTCPFTKLYICDQANRLYVLENSTIYANKQSLRLFYANHLPSLIFSVNDSKINQISVHRSQLIISTDETTRLFNEQSNQLSVIGKKKRREGFYGACFFNPTYKPLRILQISGPNSGQNTARSSTQSLSDLDNLYIFVSRPMFRLWQVNNKREVMFTHQFEPLIKSTHFKQVIKLRNEPLRDGVDEDSPDIIENFRAVPGTADKSQPAGLIRGDHFEKLVQIYSSTIGNLLLSYNQNELFVVDPIGARLIVYHTQEEPIFQVCCNENELFIWSLGSDRDQLQFQIKRLVLMATTQFVLELHRIHRYWTIVMFVEFFSDLFRQKMALPLCSTSVITTEGGLLRNVLLNAWDMYLARSQGSEDDNFRELRRMVDEIVDESKQLRRSFEDLTDSRFFLNMTNDNIDRLCSEPYASLVSLEVSLKDLHTTHVIHFNKDALDRHKSVANLSQSIQNLKRASRQIAISNMDLSRKAKNTGRRGSLQQLVAKSIVECHTPKRMEIAENIQPSNADTGNIGDTLGPLKQGEYSMKNGEKLDVEQEGETFENNEEIEEDLDRQRQRMISSRRCTKCHWPQPGSHLLRLDSSQRIQLNWIEENLMNSIEKNIDRIEKQSFKHGLWQIYLKCLEFGNQIDQYISCCFMLDDIRLLNVEKFSMVCGSDEELLNRLLVHLSENIDKIKFDKSNGICLKCGTDLRLANGRQSDQIIQEEIVDDEVREGSQFNFNLVNLFELFMKRRSADAIKFIGYSLRYPELLNSSEIPATFYLKAIALATLKANQSPLSRARLNQIQYNKIKSDHLDGR